MMVKHEGVEETEDGAHFEASAAKQTEMIQGASRDTYIVRSTYMGVHLILVANLIGCFLRRRTDVLLENTINIK